MEMHDGQGTGMCLRGRSMVWKVVIFILAVSACISFAQSTSASDDGLPVAGIGLNGINYWTVSSPFVEVARIGDCWISFKSDTNDWSDGRQVTCNDRGYPASLLTDQAVRSLVFTHTPTQYPAGEYVLTWEGDGDVTLEGRSNLLVEQHDRRAVYYYDQPIDGKGIYLTIRRTNTVDPVRNINLWMPGFENQSSIWHPAMIDNVLGSDCGMGIEPFGVIRFMDLGATNNSTLQHWSERCRPGDAHYGGGKGIPYELMIDLCNRTNKDMWVCVPHMATDDYVTRLATMIRDTLKPELRVWIEYSNEVWNSMFSQYHFVEQLGQAEGLGVARMYGRRAAQIFTIFENVFGGTSRMVRICAGQAHNPWILEQAISECSEQADVVSIAAYFTPASVSEYLKDLPYFDQDMPSIFQFMEQEFYRDTLPHWYDNKATADAYGLPMVAYEGGQHLTASGKGTEEWTELMADVNRHPLMYDFYRLALDEWRHNVGGSTFTAFVESSSWNKWGFWGHKEYATQPCSEAVKYRALVEWVAANMPDPPPPQPEKWIKPVQVTATTTQGSRVFLFWLDAFDDETGYFVIRRPADGSEPWRIIAILSADTQGFLDASTPTGLSPYNYLVFAFKQ